MKNELFRLNDHAVYFHTRYRKGAKLVNLWELAEPDLLSGQIDLILLIGGICNITDLYYDFHGIRSIWPPEDISSRFDEIKMLMSDMVNNYRLLNTDTKLCFVPESGIDLARVNSLCEPIPNEVQQIQTNLEIELDELRNFTKSLNDGMGVLTPWTLKVTHHRRTSKWIPVYSRLSDGLHPTVYQARRIAEILHKFVVNMFNLQGLYVNQR